MVSPIARFPPFLRKRGKGPTLRVLSPESAVALHCRDQGRGEPVLLLHGLGNSGRDWEFQEPDLIAAGYRVLAPDLRGFGHSPRPPRGYRIEQFAADVRGLLAERGVERAHLVGYSMGGAVAYQLAVDEPARWISLNLISSVPSFRPERPIDYWQYFVRILGTHCFGMSRIAHAVTHKLFADDPALRRKMQPRYAANDRGVYIRILTALARWDVRGRLPTIACPVLILAAENDYFRLEDVREAMAGLPQARLKVIPGTRHGLPMEAPTPVNQALLAAMSAASSACSDSASLV